MRFDAMPDNNQRRFPDRDFQTTDGRTRFANVPVLGFAGKSTSESN